MRHDARAGPAGHRLVAAAPSSMTAGERSDVTALAAHGRDWGSRGTRPPGRCATDALESQMITWNVQPATYAMFCPVPPPASGRLNATEGMVRIARLR
jgi:hypothetical protein